MKIKLIILLCGLVLCGVSGCVSVPRPSEKETMADHIEFLAQPALKGRAARSSQSRYVRKYLADRLEMYGLEPWPHMPGYHHDFGFGKNIIGVLPGSDPELAEQIVLVSAHYDHIPPKGSKYYPGAVDNASGVAALLDMIRVLSPMDNRPKRSIAFAFFDAEEEGMIGSFAFTLDDNYDDEAVVAVVNIDMLGKKFLDVIDDSLIVNMDGYYPHFNPLIEQFSADQRLTLLAMRTDLVGAFSDHVPFMLAKRPVLFFTCGWFSDYHEPTDTADRVLMEKLHRQAKVVEQTVITLANAEPRHLRVDRNRSVGTLDSLTIIIKSLMENAERFELNSETVEALDSLAAKARSTSAKQLCPNRYLDHKIQIRSEFLDIFQNSNNKLLPTPGCFAVMADLYSAIPQPLTKMYREKIRHYLENRPRLFGQNVFTYAEDISILESPWRVEQIDGDEYIFALMDLKLLATGNLNMLRGTSFQIVLDKNVYCFKGSMSEIIDYILLQYFLDGPWPRVRVAKGHFMGGKPATEAELTETSANMLAEHNMDSTEKPAKWAELAEIVANMLAEQNSAFKKSLFDLNDTGQNLKDWLLGLAESENTRLASHAIKVAGQKIPDEIESLCLRILNDKTADQILRWAALDALFVVKSSAAFYAMIDELSDTTEFDLASVFPPIDQDYPFSTHPFWSLEDITETAPVCFGSDMVYGYLKYSTGQDFGLDQNAWREWVKQASNH